MGTGFSSPDGASQRRPIAARGWRWSQGLADFLIGSSVSPNAISLASVLFAAGGAVCLAATGWPYGANWVCWLGAVAGIQLRLICNMLDGMVALGRGRGSAVGALYNEVPDRLSDTLLLVAAGYADGGDSLWGWIAALAAMFTAYVRAAASSAGAPSDFRGPMAKQHRMALLTAVCLGLAVLDFWHESALAAWPWMTWGLEVIALGSILTASARLVRAARFLRRHEAGALPANPLTNGE